MAKQNLRIKKSATEVVFNDNNYVLDFYTMMLLDLKSVNNTIWILTSYMWFNVLRNWSMNEARS
ncbi:hypothetical protein KY284_030301 [Solanum tuberosum]|nr:hypothetical protein KY284_030301 [Solanum tuberosum]